MTGVGGGGGGVRGHLSLEAGEEVDEEGMAHGVGHLEDALLCQERLHLVPGDDVSLLQRLDREILPRVLVASQYNLKIKAGVETILFM